MEAMTNFARKLSRPALSIVIVAYKSRDEIGPCLRSIPSRVEAGMVEVIVVDNYGRDGLADIIAAHFPQTLYIAPPENLGFGRANNLGFERSSGECVLFLNPDTVCTAEALKVCLKTLKTELSVGLISPRLVLSDGSLDLACRRSIPTLWDGFCRAVGLDKRFPQSRRFAGYNLTYLPIEGTYEVGAINGAFMMGRRDVLDRVGLFDPTFFMYGDDLDLCIRVKKAGYKIVYCGAAQITHLKGISVAKDYALMSRAIFDANRDVYLKHFNPRNSRLIRWKYHLAFGLWKTISLLRAKLSRYKRVKPL